MSSGGGFTKEQWERIQDDFLNGKGFGSRRQGKTTLAKEHANTLLDYGHTIRLEAIIKGSRITVTIQRFNGVDFILNDDGTYDIDGSGLMK